MKVGGFANKIIHVDLTAEKVEYKPIPEEWALKYIGGRGLGVKYVFENGPQVDPLSPENILFFMNGPLTGTEANLSGRMAVCHQIPADRHGHRQPSRRLVGSAPALGWLRRPDLQGQGARSQFTCLYPMTTS